MIIIYDRECPFCSSYVRMLRLRDAVGQVTLVDARSDDPTVLQAVGDGYDLDRGMIVRFKGQTYHGDAAMHLLTAYSEPGGIWNSLVRYLFRSPRRSALVYPVLVMGRRLTLRLLGRRPIGQGGKAG